MNKVKPALATNAMWLLSGNAIYLACQLVILSALTQYSELETVGSFGLIMAICTPIFAITGLGLRTAQSTDALGEYEFSDYFGLRIAMTFLGTLVILSTIYIWKPLLLFFALPIVLAKSIEQYSDLFYGTLQKAERIKSVAISLIMRGFLSMVLFVSFLGFGLEVELAFYAQLSAWFFVAIFHDIQIVRLIQNTIKPRFSLPALLKLGKLSAPLGAGIGIGALQISLPRFFVEFFLGSTALGLYTVVGYFQQAATIFINSIGHALSARLSQLWLASNHIRFWRIVKLFMMLSLTGASCLVSLVLFFGETFLVYIFGDEYSAASDLFILTSIAVSCLILASGFQFTLLAQRRFRVFGSLQFAFLLLVSITTFFGINWYGLEGLGYGLVVAGIVRLLVMTTITMTHKKASNSIN